MKPTRATDLATLERVLAHHNHRYLSQQEIAEFARMRGALMSGERSTLSKKQRVWLDEVDQRLKPIGAGAPKKKEPELPEVLKHLPLRPPHRMHELQRRAKP